LIGVVDRWRRPNASELPARRENLDMRQRIDWKKVIQVGGVTFLASPLNVVLHELAHLLVTTLGGIPSTVTALGSMTPIGFQWNFESLREAQAHYGAGDFAIVAGALAGPIFTLSVGYGGLLAFRRWHYLPFWAIAYSAVAIRPIANLLFLTPKVLDGTINSSDEAIAAFFLGWPVGSLWWLLVVGVVCMVMLIRALPRHERLPLAVTGFICSFVGFFIVEYLVNTLLFGLESWDR
jgi:hypothetical protein